MVCYAFVFTFLLSVIIRGLENYFTEPELAEQREAELK